MTYIPFDIDMQDTAIINKVPPMRSVPIVDVTDFNLLKWTDTQSNFTPKFVESYLVEEKEVTHEVFFGENLKRVFSFLQK